MLLRIEDIDGTRARGEYVQAIFEDLKWLGIQWDGQVLLQSEHLGRYTDAIKCLQEMGVAYPCFCTRKEILAELQRSAEAPQGPDGPLYPGTCRNLSFQERESRMQTETWALRLDSRAAAKMVGPLTWFEVDAGTIDVDPLIHGDFVLRRKDVPTSYHVSVVVDDALQGVTLVTRGNDLFPATHAQRVLQALLGYTAPRYRHHGLVVDEQGRRLAKRDDAQAVRSYREEGWSPSKVLELARARVGSHPLQP